MNATFGNATEVIIAGFAIQNKWVWYCLASHTTLTPRVWWLWEALELGTCIQVHQAGPTPDPQCSSPQSTFIKYDWLMLMQTMLP